MVPGAVDFSALVCGEAGVEGLKLLVADGKGVDVIFDPVTNKGDLSSVYIFAAIALLILLIAVVNYMNLATARSATRAREIGVRKAVGSDRRQLITQFLFESSSMTMGPICF